MGAKYSNINELLEAAACIDLMPEATSPIRWAEIIRHADTHLPYTHFCEHPLGCELKRNGNGSRPYCIYDIMAAIIKKRSDPPAPVTGLELELMTGTTR